jgi:hypothetical protein
MKRISLLVLAALLVIVAVNFKDGDLLRHKRDGGGTDIGSGGGAK